MSRAWLWVAVGLTAVVGWGCDSSKSAGKKAETSATIAVIPKGTTHEFWKAVHAGANQAAEEFKVEVIWKGPLKEDDRDEQIKVVEQFRVKGVSGIVVAPLDDKALRAPVEDAINAKIPVVIFDSALDSTRTASFVATDNLQAGKLAGQQMVRALNGKGKIVVLRYQEGSASTADRERGFLEVVRASPDIEIVSDNQYGGATTESAYKASENLLTATKAAAGGVDGIFCPNESTTFGMLRALQDAKLAGKITFVGFDSSEKLVAALKDGQINALVVQNPQRMGYLAVKTMVLHLRGEPVSPRIDTGAALVTKGNMTDPEIQAVLKPDLDKWLK